MNKIKLAIMLAIATICFVGCAERNDSDKSPSGIYTAGNIHNPGAVAKNLCMDPAIITVAVCVEMGHKSSCFKEATYDCSKVRN